MPGTDCAEAAIDDVDDLVFTRGTPPRWRVVGQLSRGCALVELLALMTGADDTGRRHWPSPLFLARSCPGACETRVSTLVVKTPEAGVDVLTSTERIRALTLMKLRMTRNGLGRSVGRTIGLVIGALWALGTAGVAVLALVALRWQDAGLAADATTAALAALTVGWALLPLLVFGVDETLDPARFVLLPLRARELLPGLLVAGLIGVPGLATALVAVGTIATWTRGLLPVVAAVVAAVLGLLTCLVIARVLTSAFARFLRSRRFGDFATALLAVGTGSLGLGINIAVGSMSTGPHDPDELRGQLHGFAEIAGATPFGWAWSIPGLVANHRWVLAGLHLVLALALVAGLGWAWERLLARNLTSPADLGGGGAKVRGTTGLADRLYPATPTGAIAGRCLRYWRRDPRYLSSIAATLVVPVLFIVSQTVGPSGGSAVAAFAPLISRWSCRCRSARTLPTTAPPSGCTSVAV